GGGARGSGGRPARGVPGDFQSPGRGGALQPGGGGHSRALPGRHQDSIAPRAAVPEATDRRLSPGEGGVSHSHTPGETCCREVFDLLSDYVDGELDSQTRETLARHLEACPPCENFLKTFQKTRFLCRESLMVRMPEELRERLRSFLQDKIGKK